MLPESPARGQNRGWTFTEVQTTRHSIGGQMADAGAFRGQLIDIPESRKLRRARETSLASIHSLNSMDSRSFLPVVQTRLFPLGSEPTCEGRG